MRIRDAGRRDLAAMLAIYNDVIATTTAIYEEQPAGLDVMEKWYTVRVEAGMPMLVADDAGEVIGFAALGPFRPRIGYRHTAEDSLHVRVDARGRGVGRKLLEALIDRACSLDVRTIVAMIDADAAASIHLHQSLGFVEVGRFREIGRMHGRWLDLVAMQKLLGAASG